MKELFKSLHGAIDQKGLIQLSTLVGEEYMPSKKSFDEVVEYLGIDEKDLYYDKGSIVGRFTYWRDCVYYNIPVFEIEALKMFKTKEAIEYFTQKVIESKRDKKYMELFGIMDKKILIPMFIKMYQEIPLDQRYDVFVHLYVRSEYGFSEFPKEIVHDVFANRSLSEEWKKRMKKFNKKMGLKQNVCIYRGQGKMSAKPLEAFSWTLKKETAQFFADRFESKGTGKVITRTIPIDKVIDYIDHRNESEIILLPERFES